MCIYICMYVCVYIHIYIYIYIYICHSALCDAAALGSAQGIFGLLLECVMSLIGACFAASYSDGACLD